MKLIDQYVPYDYRDTVTAKVDVSKGLTAEKIFAKMFCDFPKPVKWLMNLRNVIMKPFGIQGGGSFRNLVSASTDEEIILSKDDKHLCFWVGIDCPVSSNVTLSPQTESSAKDNRGTQTVSVTTVVRFHNFLGRIYFIGIWIFHKLLVGTLLRRAVR